MKRRLLVFRLLITAIVVGAFSQRFHAGGNLAETSRRPKLIVIIIVDQFRADYLQRFRPYFVQRGFNLLLGGANFVNCRYNYIATLTAPGHATLLTGSYPNRHGIIDNSWFDRRVGALVSSVGDSKVRLVETEEGASEKRGASPHYLRVSTLGDELRSASGSKSKVIAISLKERGAILPGGHSANAAYWYEPDSGGFVTSSYYLLRLPRWVASFNQESPAKAYCGSSWKALPETPEARGRVFSRFDHAGGQPCPNPEFLRWIHDTPFVSEVELQFALRAVKEESLGQDEDTDLLTVSLSANDYIGHKFGPHSPEVADTVLRTDRYLADFFAQLDRTVGLTHVWIALSADHGVAPTPSYIRQHDMGLGRFSLHSVEQAIEKSLSAKFGQGPWVEKMGLPDINLRAAGSGMFKVASETLDAEAAKAVLSVRGVKAAFTRSQLMGSLGDQSPLYVMAKNSFDPERSGDILFILEPFAVPVERATETTHGSPWDYDAHVPMLLWGSVFKPGEYTTACDPVDLVPTLASALGLSLPETLQGRPTTRVLRPSDPGRSTPSP
jgi:predicted AlkP superfamily pyrophosphatase or phosphodiesterase